jgi:hypothetical protein
MPVLSPGFWVDDLIAAIYRPSGDQGDLAESAEAIEMHIEVTQLPFIAAERRHDVHTAGINTRILERIWQ